MDKPEPKAGDYWIESDITLWYLEKVTEDHVYMILIDATPESTWGQGDEEPGHNYGSFRKSHLLTKDIWQPFDFTLPPLCPRCENKHQELDDYLCSTCRFGC